MSNKRVNKCAPIGVSECGAPTKQIGQRQMLSVWAVRFVMAAIYLFIFVYKYVPGGYSAEAAAWGRNSTHIFT